jgi:hypothetical protein
VQALGSLSGLVSAACASVLPLQDALVSAIIGFDQGVTSALALRFVAPEVFAVA